MPEQRKLAILGASRGLGAALVRLLKNETPEGHLLLSSRKFELLRELGRDGDIVVPADFTSPVDQNLIFDSIVSFAPTHIFYIAGGGPHGPYGKKKWQDHLWAYELNFLFPAKLLHRVLNHQLLLSGLEQMVFVGSAVADNQADPLASSYAAAKHGLRGLVNSVRAENPPLDLRLYSPPYMDTDLLPQSAWPRQKGLAVKPEDEAAKLLQWSLNKLD